MLHLPRPGQPAATRPCPRITLGKLVNGHENKFTTAIIITRTPTLTSRPRLVTYKRLVSVSGFNVSCPSLLLTAVAEFRGKRDQRTPPDLCVNSAILSRDSGLHPRMQQKPFIGRAQPGSAGEAHSGLQPARQLDMGKGSRRGAASGKGRWRGKHRKTGKCVKYEVRTIDGYGSP